MAEYVCKYAPRCESRMFTQDHVYPVVEVKLTQGNLEVIVDNYGHQRFINPRDPSFIVQNDHPRGAIYRAQFERRES